MPKFKNKTPSYSLHKASGQAAVKLDGRDHHFSKYGAPVSHASYQHRGKVIHDPLSRQPFPILCADLNQQSSRADLSARSKPLSGDGRGSRPLANRGRDP